MRKEGHTLELSTFFASSNRRKCMRVGGEKEPQLTSTTGWRSFGTLSYSKEQTAVEAAQMEIAFVNQND